ncbi:MAG: hypothetical protein JKY29_03720 [Gammaproteobacteria bacterium]|nr:hypothetical protein [Gammaproteobacteria bacterium]
MENEIDEKWEKSDFLDLAISGSMLHELKITPSKFIQLTLTVQPNVETQKLNGQQFLVVFTKMAAFRLSLTGTLSILNGVYERGASTFLERAREQAEKSTNKFNVEKFKHYILDFGEDRLSIIAEEYICEKIWEL